MKSVILRETAVFKWKLLVLIIGVCGNSFCITQIPVLFRTVIDGAIEHQDLSMLWVPILQMAALAGGAFACGLLMAKLAAAISMGVGRNLRKKMFEKVQDFSADEIEAFSISSLIVRTNTDITVIQFFMTAVMGMVMGAPVTFVISIVTAFSLSPELAVVILPVMVVIFAMILFISKKAERLSDKMQAELDRINLLFRERLGGVKVIRAFGRDGLEIGKFKEVNQTYKVLGAHQGRMTQILMPAFLAILGVSICILVYVGYRYAVEGQNVISTGTLVSVIELVVTILLQVAFLGIILTMLPRARVSSHRVQEVLSTEIPLKDPKEPHQEANQKGVLEFREVSYTYPGSKEAALSGLSFVSKPGEITAFIGSTGSGKTTAVNLIPRLKDVTKGQVLVDGIDVRDYPLETLRGKIGFVPQKSMLFSGTIRSNLEFGHEGADEEALEQALKTAQAFDFSMQKPGGFDAEVSQGGANFSGGQKQRLCIARALTRTPEIYVFDDSFSALDFKTDRKIRASLREQVGDSTVILVTQRIGTVMDCDRIIVLENGQVAGIGTHESLLSSCPVYQEIAASQLGKEAVSS